MSLLEFFGVAERPAELAPGPMDDYYYQTIARQTTAGVRVDEGTAFTYSVCWAATRLLAGTSGWLPFNLYKRLPNGGAAIDAGHRVHRLIHDQPNSDMGAMMFRACGMNHQVNSGNCFSEIVRLAGGQPMALEPIHPRRIPPNNIKRDDNGKLIYYVYRPDGIGQPQKLKQEDIFHVPSVISDDGIIGKGVVTHARESIGKAIGTQRRGAAAQSNGGMPPLALKGAKFKNKEEKDDFRRQINEVHGGPENAGKWLLLPTDTEVEKLGFSLEDSQFIESENFDIEEICRWYGVPPHLVGHLLRATFNNIEELGISFVKYSLIQWLKLWEQEVWRKLLTQREQDTHYAKFVVDALERGNLESRTEAGVKKFFNGLWTLNDWAKQEDMNPIEETAQVDGKTVSLGDLHFVQQAMIPLSMAAKGPEKPEPPTEKPPEKPATETMAASIALAMSPVVTSLTEVASGLKQLSLSVDANHTATLKRFESSEEKLTGLDVANGKLTEAVSVLASDVSSITEQNAALQRDWLAAAESSAALNRQLRQLALSQLRDVLGRLMSVEIHNVKQTAQTASKFDQRLLAFYDEKHRRTMERAMVEPTGAALSAAGKSDEPAAFVRSYIDGHVAESMQQLLGCCDCTAEELPSRVEACVAKWHEERTSIEIG
jgi:HK97 family phage portal protein